MHFPIHSSLCIGPKWFDMKAAERTESLENDLTLLSLRRSLFPKEFYRRSDLKPGQLPKFCQVGTMLHDALDGPPAQASGADRAEGGRRVRRARTLAEELLTDAQFMSHAKRVYGRTQASKQKREGILRSKLRVQKARQRRRDRRKSALEAPS